MDETSIEPQPPKPDPLGAPNADYVKCIRERDEARAALAKAEEELQKTRVKLYDAMQKVETLETEKASKATQNEEKRTKAAKRNSQKSIITPSKIVVIPKQTEKKTEPHRHPVVPGLEALATDTYAFYHEIGERFPSLKVSQVMAAELKFIDADLSNDGLIDSDELDNVLTSKVTIYTPSQIKEIMKEIDKDESGAVDYFEVLLILDKLTARRKTNLPIAVKENQSKLCSIQ